MNPVLRRILAALAGGALACAMSASARAQVYPIKPIRLIAPISPGAASDVLARIVAPEMAAALGQPVVVENRPGADSLVGSEYVAKQVPADGYTIVIILVGTLTSLPVLTKGVRFDPLKDLPPFIGLAEGKFTLVSSNGLPWTTFDELVARAKPQPGRLNYGVGTALGRLLVEAVMQDLGVSMVHVPYPVVANYMQALTAQDIAVGLVSEQLAIAQREKLRVLAVTGEERSKTFPDAPTFKELGFPRVKGLSFTLNAPAGVPQPIIDRLQRNIAAVVASTEYRGMIEKAGSLPVSSSPAELRQVINQTLEDVASSIREFGMQQDQ